MQEFIRKNLVYKIHMRMGSFGAATPKGTHLWGPHENITKFSLPLPQKAWDEQLVSKKLLPDGRVQITGNSALKGSQAYPAEFGRATVGIWGLTPKRKLPSLSSSQKIPKWPLSNRQDKWPDADLSEVMQFLSLGTLK